MDRGLSGALEGPSSYLMKSPPMQYHDSVARQLTEDFITANRRATDNGVVPPGTLGERVASPASTPTAG
jgi:myo-inositol-1-phosphate synthase